MPAVALHAVGAHAPEFQAVAEPVFEIEKDAGETSDRASPGDVVLGFAPVFVVRFAPAALPPMSLPAML